VTAPDENTVPEVTPLRWRFGRLELLDQTLLPREERWVVCEGVEAVVEAIRSLRVRGAPAIGIAGGYGLAVAAREAVALGLEATAAWEHVRRRSVPLAEARPTAVNLRWAVERCLDRAARAPAASAEALAEVLLAEAMAIHEDDRRLCAAIGGHGADILPAGNILTHCNTGGLATGGDGTALAAIVEAWRRGRRFEVFADETRPLFQGSRLTAWELVRRGIPVTVLVDAAAPHLMKIGRVASVIVGADRIAANGDTANKIGTYGLAVAARAHGIPFYVAAPSSTFDLSAADGDAIPIEERIATEVTCPAGVPTAAGGAKAFNPAFDVTPAPFVTGIITERGVIAPVGPTTVAAMLAGEEARTSRG
jgi:methylthioribose-1-phosphate isomerase